MKLSNSQKAVLALIAANIIWGAAPPVFKWSLEDIGPYTLAFLRFFFASILIFPFLKGKFRVNPKDYFRVFLIGFFGITINIIFFFLGLLQTPSINAAIIASAAPVFIIIFSIIFIREKPKNRIIWGSLIGLLGILVFLVEPFFNSGGFSASLGNFLIIIATLGAILHTIIGRQVLKRNNPVTVTFWMFVVGTVGFLPFFVNEVKTIGFLPHLTGQAIVGIIFGAVLSSFIAYFFHSYALKFLQASDVGLFAYIDPVVSVLIAAPLLGEIPDTTFLLGATMVFGGIFIAEGRINYHPIQKFFKK